MAAAEPTSTPVALPHHNLLLLPILHGRLECADLVRQAFMVQPPDAVAVELPPTLEAAVLQAVTAAATPVRGALSGQPRADHLLAH